jgi:hypothetical protein
VESGPSLQTLFLFDQRFHFDRRPGEAVQVAQLKTPPTIDVILQAPLAELKIRS